MPLRQEHIIPERAAKRRSDYLIFLRCVYAYHLAAKFIDAADQILEIGSGDGYGAFHLAKVGKSVIACDMDPDVLQESRHRYSAPQLRFLASNALALPFRSETFDVVVAFQVIEHISEDQEFLYEVNRVLKPGGCFVLTTPNRESRLKPGQRPFNPHHVREYSSEQLQARLQCVFPDVEMRGVRGTAEVEAVETARVNWHRRLAAFDPFHLRLYVPVPVKNALLKVLRGLLSPESAPLLDQQSQDDFSVFSCTSKDLQDAMDLFAVCRRPATTQTPAANLSIEQEK
jgi:SAM-dependent methyltransferase